MRLYFLVFSFLWCEIGADYGITLQRGIQEQKNGNCARAIKAYKEVVEEKPHIYQVYPRMGFCFEKLGYPKIAIKYYRKTLDYDPQNAVAIKALKRFKAEQLALERKTRKPVLVELSSGSNNLVQGSSSSIEDLGRLWVLREGQILTLRRDGSDLTPYSEVAFYQMGQFQPGSVGIPVVYQQKEFQPDIFFMYPEDSTMVRLSRCPVPCQDPVYFKEQSSVVYIKSTSSTVNEAYAVEVVEFEDQLKPRRILNDFEWVGDFRLHRDRLYFSGKKPDQKKKIYSYSQVDGKVSQESFGLGVDRNPKPSPNGKYLAVQRQTEAGKWNWHLFERGTKYNYQLTFFDGTEIQGGWEPGEEYFYFSTSQPGTEDRWNSVLGRVLVSEKFIEELQKTNFLYQDFKIDSGGDHLYYLTNYDNNYEVYRLPLVSEGLPERLTMSQADEMQYGFWTFSNY